MKAISQSDLAILTSKDARTVKARLAEAAVTPISTKGRTSLYDSAIALQAILAPARGGVEHLSPTDKLAHARWELAQHELAIKRGEYVAVTAVQKHWVGLASTMRAIILATPHNLAPLLARETNPGKCCELVETELHRALHEIAGNGVPDEAAAAAQAARDAETARRTAHRTPEYEESLRRAAARSWIGPADANPYLLPGESLASIGR